MSASLIIAAVLWVIAKQEVMPVTPIYPKPPTRTILQVVPVRCTQPWLCTFDVVGHDGVLGDSILVDIQGFTAPAWNGSWCWYEEEQGEKATTYLWELMAGAKEIVLLGAYKDKGFPAIKARLFIDGIDIAWKMVELGVAAPQGVKVDWCEEPPEEIEV